jgi:zinc protease
VDDVRDYYKRTYHLPAASGQRDAFVVISGDVTTEHALKLAEGFLKGMPVGAAPGISYPTPPVPAKARIILVDHPESKQAMIRMAAPGYDLHSDGKYVGSVASHVLSGDIDSRLGREVRSKRGLAYSVWAHFSPQRHGGTFSAGTETKLETAGSAVRAMLDVFEDMAKKGVEREELGASKTSITGSMVMGMQTVDQQADMRGRAILNDYPEDYYDQYPAHIAGVTADQVRDVMRRCVDPNKFTIVVVAPASQVRGQLEKIGPVEVVPMPARGSATTRPSIAE